MGMRQFLAGDPVKSVITLGGLVFGTAFKWVLVALSANFFGALAILIALDSEAAGWEKIDSATEYFFVSGAAGMLAIGLLTTSVAELTVRRAGQVAYLTGLVAIVAVVLLAALYGDFLTGAGGLTRDEAQPPTLVMIAFATVIGAWSHLLQNETLRNIAQKRTRQASERAAPVTPSGTEQTRSKDLGSVDGKGAKR